MKHTTAAATEAWSEPRICVITITVVTPGFEDATAYLSAKGEDGSLYPCVADNRAIHFCNESRAQRFRESKAFTELLESMLPNPKNSAVVSRIESVTGGRR